MVIPYTFILATMALLAVMAIVAVNIENYRRRKIMTPEERNADDEESRREATNW
jgi:hypothetical protein